MKTKDELNVLKEEVEALNRKLHELTDEEFADVAGGDDRDRTKLDEYLKRLCPDKNKILIDNGEGKKLELKNTVEFDDKNNAYIIKRD